MAWHTTFTRTNGLGQRVEYHQEYGEETSRAEGRAKIVVSGRTVKSGWSSDGETYRVYEQWVRKTKEK